MKLILKRFGKIIEERLLEEGAEYLIGRHKDCDMVLNEEQGLSRKHLKIYQSGETGNWIIESLSDLGGLYLEGEEVDGAEMEADSSFSLKNYVLEFKTQQKPAEQAPLPAKVPSNAEAPAESAAGNLPEETLAGGETKFLAQPHLLYSLYIYIQGEFSDHIRLNDKTSWTVGRAKECDISIDYNILTRKHLKIFNKDGAFYVEDLNSANKTFVNGQELSPHKSVLLRANDKISVSDLKIIFEVRNQNLEKMMSHLQAPNDDDKEDSLPAMAMPKVILEDTPLETAKPQKTPFKNSLFTVKNGLIALAAAVGLGITAYSQYKEIQEEKMKIAQQRQEKEQQGRLEIVYQEALKSREEAQYSFCILHLEKLHGKAGGHYKDSEGLLTQCQLGATKQKEMEEQTAQEEEEKKTSEKIKKIVEKCQKEFADKIIQTSADLDKCAEELTSGLDPINADIAAIRTKITEQENLQSLQEEKREALKQKIQAKKALYNKALRLQKQEKPLKAVSAYNVFLKSVKNFAPLKKLKAKAQAERDGILSKYNSNLQALHDSCNDLIKAGKMKEAYYDCKKVLEFKNDDQKAKQAIRQAQSDLQKKLKPLYEQSVLDESFSRIEEAKKIWEEILSKDIKEGYYYQKAQFQLNKYK